MMTDETRVCSRCGERKPVENFYWKVKARGWRQSCCKECNKKAVTGRRPRNREREREISKASYRRRKDLGIALLYRLRRSALELGLDPDVIQAHYKAHNGLCDICGRTPVMASQPKERLCIDHDHLTGAFRGLLCVDCNLLLGVASDDVKRLLAAVDYLEHVQTSESRS